MVDGAWTQSFSLIPHYYNTNIELTYPEDQFCAIISVMTKIYKIIFQVPVSHADAVRQAICDAGAGKIGNYDNCTFSTKGVGRYRPLEGSNPTIGQIGQLEQVEEEQVDTIVAKEHLSAVLAALKVAHPYETPAVDVFALEDVGFNL